MRMQHLVVIGAVAFGSLTLSASVNEEKLDGYAEYRKPGLIVVDGQRVRVNGATKYKGKGPKDVNAIPLGYRLRAQGPRLPDGSILATEIDSEPNGSQLFESEVLASTNEAEQAWLHEGRVFEPRPDGRMHTIGRIHESGPGVARAARIIRRLTPPYMAPDAFRVYTVDSKEWNAMAMGNGAVWIFSSLLDDMDDDEVALVVGHELTHVTHEHTRKEFKRGMWIQLLAIGVAATAETIDNDKARAVVQLAGAFGFTAWHNGYGRELEDQADRVGLRYAYEGGYDVTRAPNLWRRFAAKYGEQNKVENFFFSDHSTALSRASKTEREIALNYPDAVARAR